VTDLLWLLATAPPMDPSKILLMAQLMEFTKAILIDPAKENRNK